MRDCISLASFSAIFVSCQPVLRNSTVLVGLRFCTEAAMLDRLLACVRHCGNAFMHSEYRPRKHGSSCSLEGTLKEAPASCDSEFRGLGWSQRLHDLRDYFGHCLGLMKPNKRSIVACRPQTVMRNSAVLVGSRICTEAARSDRLLVCVRHCGNAFMHSEYRPHKHGSSYIFEGTPNEAPPSCDSEFSGLGCSRRLHDLQEYFGHCSDLMKPNAPLWLPDRRLCQHGTRSHTCLGCFSVSKHSEPTFKGACCLGKRGCRSFAGPRTSTAKGV